MKLRTYVLLWKIVLIPGRTRYGTHGTGQKGMSASRAIPREMGAGDSRAAHQPGKAGGGGIDRAILRSFDSCRGCLVWLPVPTAWASPRAAKAVVVSSRFRIAGCVVACATVAASGSFASQAGFASVA